MMFYNFVLLQIFFFVCTTTGENPGGSVSKTTPIIVTSNAKEHCRPTKKLIYQEKEKCIQFLFSGKPNDESNCNDTQSLEEEFIRDFNKTADCYGMPELREKVNSSVLERVNLVKEATKDAKKFFANGGLSCINAAKNKINGCIHDNIKGINETQLKNSILKQKFLSHNKPTCSRGRHIFNCIVKVLNTTASCTNTSVEYIRSLHKAIEKYCTMDTTLGQTWKPNLTGIIIGCLAALIVVLLAILFLIKKLGKRSDSPNEQAQSYNVSFQPGTDKVTRMRG